MFVVQGQPAVIEESAEGGALVAGIAEGSADRGLVEGDGGLLVAPGEECLDLPEPAVLQAVLEKHRPARLAPQQESSVERWAAEVKAMHELGASLSAIKRMCRRLEAEHGPRAEAVAIPVETAPGQVAQVDFGDVGVARSPGRSSVCACCSAHAAARPWSLSSFNLSMVC